jgi:hypothetical protein
LCDTNHIDFVFEHQLIALGTLLQAGTRQAQYQVRRFENGLHPRFYTVLIDFSFLIDDIALAAALLYMNTNQSSYLNDSVTYYNSNDGQNAWSEESWDSQGGHLHVLLYNLTKDATYLTNFKTFAAQYLPGPTQSFNQTPLGLAFPE